MTDNLVLYSDGRRAWAAQHDKARARRRGAIKCLSSLSGCMHLFSSQGGAAVPCGHRVTIACAIRGLRAAQSEHRDYPGSGRNAPRTVTVIDSEHAAAYGPAVRTY
jgi:hypothetical protein